MTEPTPHALGFTWELENRLSVAQDAVERHKRDIAKQGLPWEPADVTKGRIRAQEWLVKTIKQALARDAPRGDE